MARKKSLCLMAALILVAHSAKTYCDIDPKRIQAGLVAGGAVLGAGIKTIYDAYKPKENPCKKYQRFLEGKIPSFDKEVTDKVSHKEARFNVRQLASSKNNIEHLMEEILIDLKTRNTFEGVSLFEKFEVCKTDVLRCSQEVEAVETILSYEVNLAHCMHIASCKLEKVRVAESDLRRKIEQYEDSVANQNTDMLQADEGHDFLETLEADLITKAAVDKIPQVQAKDASS